MREFVRRVFDHVTPAVEVRCPKDMEALVWQDVQEIIRRWGPQRSRAHLKQLLSTWHEGECCQSLAAEPCACLSLHIDLSKRINDIQCATCMECMGSKSVTAKHKATQFSHVVRMCSTFVCTSPDIGMCCADKNRQALKGTHKVISQILIEGLKQC